MVVLFILKILFNLIINIIILQIMLLAIMLGPIITSKGLIYQINLTFIILMNPKLKVVVHIIMVKFINLFI